MEWRVTREDVTYPKILKEIRRPPECLYIRGKLPNPDKPCVAVIGARRCTSYGREMAEWFGRELAKKGVQIISGMAAGVDGIAQAAAMHAGGSSFAVLGSGVDVCYPEENRNIYQECIRQGGILSEYPKGTPPIGKHFPMRNRIISAFADAVLVIEAKEKSGTLITVEFALEQGKDVFVVPGRITDPVSSGCNGLLRQGAFPALEPEDVLDIFEYKCDRRAVQKEGKEQTGKEVILDFAEKKIWEALSARPQNLQSIYEKIEGQKSNEKIEISEVMGILMEMLLKELVLQEDENGFLRNPKYFVSSI